MASKHPNSQEELAALINLEVDPNRSIFDASTVLCIPDEDLSSTGEAQIAVENPSIAGQNLMLSADDGRSMRFSPSGMAATSTPTTTEDVFSFANAKPNLEIPRSPVGDATSSSQETDTLGNLMEQQTQLNLTAPIEPGFYTKDPILKIFGCNQCAFSDYTTTKMTDHILKSHNANNSDMVIQKLPFWCGLCDSGEPNQKYFHLHLATHFVGNQKLRPTRNRAKILQCRHCEVTSVDADEMAQHLAHNHLDQLLRLYAKTVQDQ